MQMEDSTFSGPIFVCGTSRSGTTLLQSALEKNPQIQTADETHYFDDLRVRLGERMRNVRLEGSEREDVENYFLALSHRPFGHRGNPDEGWMQRDVLRSNAHLRGGCADHYFEAFCVLWAQHHGGTIWGEKTPRHVFRLNEILSRYPNGKVIFMLRDPRGVVASYRDWKNQGGFDFEKDPEHASTLQAEHERTRRSYHPVTISLLWVAAVRAAREAQSRFGVDRVRLQRYEALCDTPEQEMGSLFDWLGIARPDDMVQVPVLNSSYEKHSQSGGFLKGASDRWVKTLSPTEISVCERCCGQLLQQVGYPKSTSRASILQTLPYFCSAIPAMTRAAVLNAHRSGNLPQYILRRAGFIFGR